jgi:hypothetical protein
MKSFKIIVKIEDCLLYNQVCISWLSDNTKCHMSLGSSPHLAEYPFEDNHNWSCNITDLEAQHKRHQPKCGTVQKGCEMDCGQLFNPLLSRVVFGWIHHNVGAEHGNLIEVLSWLNNQEFPLLAGEKRIC